MRVIGPQDLLEVPAPPSILERRIRRVPELTLSIAGIAIRARFEDDAVRERFARRYREHLCAAEPSISYGCGTHEGAYYFWHDAATWCWPADRERLPLEAVLLFADATAMSALVRSDPSLVSFHAAAIADDGGAAAILGDSTAGKTTTTVACARRGMQVYTDERLLMREDLRVLPCLRAFNIRSGGALLLERDAISDAIGAKLAARTPDREWTDLSPRDIVPHFRMPRPAPLRAIFLLEGTAAHPQVREADAMRSCPRLLQSLDCAARARMDRAARVLTMLRSVRVYGLTLGTPDASAAAIENTLREVCADAA